jgi:hypothetical protein
LEKEDYYLEKGFVVFTAKYLLKRGFCCRSGCRHCPYPDQKTNIAVSENKKDKETDGSEDDKN